MVGSILGTGSSLCMQQNLLFLARVLLEAPRVFLLVPDLRVVFFCLLKYFILEGTNFALNFTVKLN